MKDLLKHIKDVAQGKAALGETRSGHWPKVRKEHLEKFPTCAVCGGSKNLEVHHKMPFHKDPTLELNPDNLITLCESKQNGVNCHLWFGHLGNFKSFNKDVQPNADEWAKKKNERP